MMKSLSTFILGFAVGVGVLGAIIYSAAPKMMLIELQSPYGIEESVAKIKQNVEKLNREQRTKWVVPSVKALHKSIKKHGGKDVLPVTLVNLCEPFHASKILAEDDARIVSVMMPCTISIYEKSDGKTYIGHMNAGLLGSMFGGVVAEVMGEVDGQQRDILNILEQ